MSTRKIMNAKDLITNDIIYFRSHDKATYMSDGTTTVEDGINAIGNISVSYPIVNNGLSDVSATIAPNVFHIWGNICYRQEYIIPNNAYILYLYNGQ